MTKTEDEDISEDTTPFDSSGDFYFQTTLSPKLRIISVLCAKGSANASPDHSDIDS